MTSQPVNSKSSYLIHCIYAGSFLLATALYISYQVWDRVQINNEIKVQNEERKINRAAQALKEIERREKISSCLKIVSNLYSRSWADTCVSQNQKIKNAYVTCLRDAKAWSDYISYGSENKKKLYTYKISECKSLYQFTSKANPNCTLPKSIAESLNAELNKMESHCRADA